jgi:DNA/RNA endonuclease YhcR with UshA esterase domain
MPSRAFPFPWPLAAVALLSCAAPFARADERAATAVADAPATPVISADEALSHVGETCTIEFVVHASRRLADKNVCFLNSKKDFRAEGTFTVVIFKPGLERLMSDGIAEPETHYRDATIRVHGVVAKREGRAQIVVDEPGQIVVVETAKAP